MCFTSLFTRGSGSSMPKKASSPPTTPPPFIPITMSNDRRPYPPEAIPNARPMTNKVPSHHFTSKPRSSCPVPMRPRGQLRNRRGGVRGRQARPVFTRLGSVKEEESDGAEAQGEENKEQESNGNANAAHNESKTQAQQQRQQTTNPPRRVRKTIGNPSERYFQAEGIDANDFAYGAMETEEMSRREDAETMRAELEKHREQVKSFVVLAGLDGEGEGEYTFGGEDEEDEEELDEEMFLPVVKGDSELTNVSTIPVGESEYEGEAGVEVERDVERAVEVEVKGIEGVEEEKQEVMEKADIERAKEVTAAGVSVERDS